MDAFDLENQELALTVAPQGATVLKLDSRRHRLPVLRRWTGDKCWHPADSALFPMLPLANRVDGNRFCWRGAHVALPASPLDKQFFLHGDGWLRRWRVAARDAEHIVLALAGRHDCGFDYCARLIYRLVNNEFQADLTLMHRGAHAMVYGLGFHPFFHLETDSRIQFSASGYWPEGECHLPQAWRDTLPAPADFSVFTAPANAWLNVGYSGWNGCAFIESGAMRVRLTASTSYLMVFRMANQPFICLEPQSHPVNAHNMAGMPGLVALRSGESVQIKMAIQVT